MRFGTPPKKTGALRHGVPFQRWDLPVPIRTVRDRILTQEHGDRAFVDLLLMPRALHREYQQSDHAVERIRYLFFLNF